MGKVREMGAAASYLQRMAAEALEREERGEERKGEEKVVRREGVYSVNKLINKLTFSSVVVLE